MVKRPYSASSKEILRLRHRWNAGDGNALRNRIFPVLNVMADDKSVEVGLAAGRAKSATVSLPASDPS
jgi:hypothetical protein